MNRTLRNIFLILILTLFLNLANAQPRKGEFINASIGLGLSAPDDNSDIDGNGFYAQGEYVFGITKWFGLRPYAGFIITSSPKNEIENQPQYKVTSKAFLFGGKARICAPIPWIAPYIESGIGASIGSFETYTPFTNIKKSGILLHVPFTLGLALGPKHNVDIAFTYYFHSEADQFSGAAAFGLTFPINQ